jgi:hypothetical protein
VVVSVLSVPILWWVSAVFWALPQAKARRRKENS